MDDKYIKFSLLLLCRRERLFFWNSVSLTRVAGRTPKLRMKIAI